MTDKLYKIAVNRHPLDRKLPQGDPFWATFNASFDNRELTPNVLANEIYNGKSLTTWHKDHRRITANYLCGQHIGLDFDAGDETSDMWTLINDKFISKYAAMLYTTMSHTNEAPRCRAIFLLDTPIMQARNYSIAAAALLWMFGTADRQCKDAVRFFYGSSGCEFQILGNILPIEVVKRAITNYQESGATEKRKAIRSEYSAPASQQEVADALQLIPPWGVDYDEWVQVLMGIHSQFGNDGYGLANAWADGKDDEVDRKWKSFDKSGNGQGAITIATVFGIAKRFGWRKHE